MNHHFVTCAAKFPSDLSEATCVAQRILSADASQIQERHWDKGTSQTGAVKTGAAAVGEELHRRHSKISA